MIHISGVVGMDGSASVALGDGRSLFVFGDTFFGSINGENGEREIREMVDYSFAIVSDARSGDCFSGAPIVRDRVERDAAWEPRDRFWPGHGLRVGNTIVMFFNDNGGPAGAASSNGIYRGFKNAYWEGGVRVASLIRYPDHIPAGSVVDDRSITTHTLDEPMALLRADGTPGLVVSQVSIRNNEAIILVTP